MLDDGNIIILMQLDPQTRTEFLRKTYFPGLKLKLRLFAKQMVYTPQWIHNFNDLDPFINLMRYGGVPPQEILENLPEEWENLRCNQMERDLCTEFIKMYLDCGFIYGPHLKPILNHVDNMDFDFFCRVYQHVIKFDKENASDTMNDFSIGEHIYSLQNIRIEFLVYQIEYMNISPDLLQKYLTFDMNHLKLDTCIIFVVLLRGLKKDPDQYLPYLEEIVKIDFPKTDKDINHALMDFFGSLVHEAINCRSQYRPIIESLTKFYPYMAKTLFAFHRMITGHRILESQRYKYEKSQELEVWILNLVDKMIHNPKDLGFAFLLEYYSF